MRQTKEGECGHTEKAEVKRKGGKMKNTARMEWKTRSVVKKWMEKPIGGRSPLDTAQALTEWPR